MSHRLPVCLLVTAVPLLLHGCAAGLVAAQAVPMAVGTVALANADEGDAFSARGADRRPWSADEMAVLDAYVRRAECGEAASQFWLAAALQNDFNATPNDVEAYKWFRLAEIGAYAPASARRAALDQSMSAPDIAQARSRVRQWQPRTEDCPPGLGPKDPP